MVFVKIYEYHIEESKEEYFLEIQEKAVRIYRKYLNCDVMYLKSIEQGTMWLEISRYNSEEEFLKAIQKVNKEPALKELYEQFESCLVSDKNSIRERNFIMKLRL